MSEPEEGVPLSRDVCDGFEQAIGALLQSGKLRGVVVAWVDSDGHSARMGVVDNMPTTDVCKLMTEMQLQLHRMTEFVLRNQEIREMNYMLSTPPTEEVQN